MTSSTTPTDVQELTKRLEALEGERGVLRTLYRYGHSIDYGLEQEWLDCFTEDGVFDLRSRSGLALTGLTQASGRYVGRDALARFIARSAKPPAKYRKHLLIEPVITLNGNEARVESYYAALHERDGVPFLRAFGRYRDRMVKGADGVWRFQERLDELEAWAPRT